MASPAKKSVVFAAQTRCVIGSDEPCLDDQRTRAAHRVEKLSPPSQQFGPSRSQQDSGCDVLLQRRLAARHPETAAMQTFAGQINGHREVVAMGMGVHLQARSLELDVRPCASDLTQ